jgi:hypothetical protein
MCILVLIVRKVETMTKVIITDGGRAKAGFKGQANDCVTRAVAIITGRPYKEVYEELAKYEQAVTGIKSARNGISKKAYKKYLADQGFTWTPTMQVGQGTTVHLKGEELPSGKLVVSVSRHMVAVIDRVVYDSHDPTRGGTRAVYGYWTKAS